MGNRNFKNSSGNNLISSLLQAPNKTLSSEAWRLNSFFDEPGSGWGAAENIIFDG